MNKNILLGAGMAAGMLTALSVWNYRRFTLKPLSLGSATYDVKIQTLPIRAGEHTLYGELLLPKDKSGLLPTVICCSGFGTSFQFCKKTVGMCLAMSGFAAYCFDFYGGCKGSKSGGTMLEMSIFTEQDDLSAVIEHIKTLDVVDQENLFLLGESQGGCVAGITAPVTGTTFRPWCSITRRSASLMTPESGSRQYRKFPKPTRYSTKRSGVFTPKSYWILIFTGRLPSMTGRFSLSTATRIRW